MSVSHSIQYSRLLMFGFKDGAYYCYCTRSAHLEILGFPMDSAYLYRDIFARFKTMRKKQNFNSKCSWYPKRKFGEPCIFQR